MLFSIQRSHLVFKQDGSGDATVSSELKEAFPARQLLACADRGVGGGDDPPSDYNALSVLKAGADAWVTGSSNPRECS